MSAWLLPDSIADVLPSEARHIEELRRHLLDTACSYGYELVMPPLLEHLDSLLTGTGEALDLQTFKLVDQLSGRSLGLRADTTPQVARIDAHLLGRTGVARLCYCGPVAHTRPDRALGTREPLQLGAELFGHAGAEADLEIMQLALDCLQVAELPPALVDMADVRIVRALMAGLPVEASVLQAVHTALAIKDVASLRELTANFPKAARDGLLALPQLYGDVAVLDEAAKALPDLTAIRQSLDHLRWLAQRLNVGRIGFDLADLRGYAYYSGVRFAAYVEGASDAVVRGGRYDGVGAVFAHDSDRDRPAVGFSLDLKALVRVAAPRALKPAIRAPWGDEPALAEAVAGLRRAGETVIRVLPGHDSEIDEFACDRQLVKVGEHWQVQAVAA
ncbi:ATP phosphoribosyltransferase regulatory subunit [Comamonas serinivorans]|uniref:ATP phosphoribosyltransferase regulatory subunit n=1 Tax=Comamonas serinivorans TaxID=1082851 RepID=A0A1Y0EN24_9BURK|nr:ATP phosphoribosyltransferase regulatory subunit [Comamonas serinivorans]ARU04850.1 ATP phosphoribosyltransferase regulatory subunit [Comamonas serinivorans]